MNDNEADTRSITLRELDENDIYFRMTADGRTEVYVATNYSNQREVTLFVEPIGLKRRHLWLGIEGAVVEWLELPAHERAQRRRHTEGK